MIPMQPDVEPLTAIYRESQVSDASIKWGSNDDPRGLLEDGKEYEVEKVMVCLFHTKIILTDFPEKKFNSVGFQMTRDDAPGSEEFLNSLRGEGNG